MSKTVCHCMNVTEDQIKEAIKNGADTLEKVMEVTKAGTGCGGCQNDIEWIIKGEK